MDKNNLEHKRHSLAHLLAAAVLEIYPDTKLTIGPAIDNGFYYDFEFSAPLSDKDLPKIQNKMKGILKHWVKFTHKEVTEGEAKEIYAGNPYKTELIEEISHKGEKITLYTAGKFTDLCRGGHSENPAKDIDPESFKLDRIAGAYWRGDEKNKMLTRIYGLAFETKNELDEYIAMQEEAKKRDHRELGRLLQLFTFDEEIGPGLPIWLPKGNIVKEQLENWAKETEREGGYQRVTTPIITKESLFYTSGHLPMYKDSMYAPIKIENDNYYIKPMNCPFHHKVFSSSSRSYRELPLRIAEYGWCHRYEDSGSLFGMMRVRGMQMNDAHIYTTREQAVEEFVKVINLHEYYYKILGIKKYEMILALRDPKNMTKYHGEEADWKLAEEMTIQAMEKSGVPYKIVHEGAAFYGPKMDFEIYSSIGRSFTASTNQLDLFMGKRFKLEYIDQNGERQTPVVIHRAPLGTHERFIGFLIEHFGGAFPLWLSPNQVTIIAVSDKFQDYANGVYNELKSNSIRVELTEANESLGKRIRESETMKTPYIIIVGEKEVTDGTVSVRARGGKDMGALKLHDFIKKLQEEIKTRA